LLVSALYFNFVCYLTANKVSLYINQRAVAAYSLGSISDVSLAGAISTGVHGTGKNFSDLPYYVSVCETVHLLCISHNG